MYRSLCTLEIERWTTDPDPRRAGFIRMARVKVTYQGHPVHVANLTDANGEAVVEIHDLDKFLAKVDRISSQELVRAFRR